MLLRVQHETKLTYSNDVAETVFEVRMGPPSEEDQTCLGYRLRITPASPVTVYQDGFGNRVDLFNLYAPYRELLIRATSVVRTHRTAGGPRLAEVPFEPEAEEFQAIEALEYRLPTSLVGRSAELTSFVESIPQPSGSLLEVVEQLMSATRSRLIYEKKVTSARTPVDEALALGRGVCQDFAHLFLGACRGFGLPARYVSGYIHEPGEIATHAWCQVWAGRNGWVDVDPTRGEIVGDDYVRIALGRDYLDVPPNRGIYRGQSDETINVAVKVENIQRMPSDWGEWSEGSDAPWSAASWIQSERQHQRGRLSQMLSQSQATFRQQQSQQQQTP
ncbi:transglutaminase family protein [Paludisphaera rhizosphaerae]|uniref:transglutaminase family protein n=1 Tax=Paludisphaera rhizosphaerae TaxID=2711216 RepID=UPI0013E9FBF2|nr:transglutaminase family protein [Paludisphaera rhizosphaerae]